MTYTVVVEFGDGSSSKMEGMDKDDVLMIVAGTLVRRATVEAMARTAMDLTNFNFTSITITEEEIQ
jgi:hypothetical protein